MTTYGCDCCQRTGLHDDEIFDFGGDRLTVYGLQACPTECIYCREERTP
jgi:hypothetical protein